MSTVIATIVSVPLEETRHKRHIPLDNVHNLRTLGGIRTADGRQLKAGMLYRSDAISDLTRADLDRLALLSLNVVSDFRSVEERLVEPDQLPPGDAQLSLRPLGVMGDTDRHELLKSLSQFRSAQESIAWMSALYRSMVSTFTPVFRDWLHSLLNEDQYPQLYHCTSGKDRTGGATALLLKILGVSDDMVREDFLLSNDLLGGRIEVRLSNTPFYSQLIRGLTPEALRPIMEVRKEYLEATFDQVNRGYGSFDQYIENGLQLDEKAISTLKALLLEPVKAD
ncbi:MAG: tyrosine-protein phosphatase [Endozoicomonas sp.]